MSENTLGTIAVLAAVLIVAAVVAMALLPVLQQALSLSPAVAL